MNCDNSKNVNQLSSFTGTAQRIIAVLGGRQAEEPILNLAYQVGQKIALHEGILICGGKSGIMAAACQGAYEAGGLTIGILPSANRAEANPWVRVAIPTGIGVARNVLILNSCDAAIAINGKYGTLSEIAYCLQFEKPICGLQTWDIPGIHIVETPQAAIDYVFE